MDARVEVSTPPIPDTLASEIDAELVRWITGPEGIVATAFKIEGYPYKWKDIKPATAAWKAAHGYNPWADQTRTGALQAAARHAAVWRGPGRMLFTVTDSAIADYHQKGTSKMPARDPLPEPTEEDCREESEKIAAMILRAGGFNV